jgi:hypothetical protein
VALVGALAIAQVGIGPAQASKGHGNAYGHVVSLKFAKKTGALKGFTIAVHGKGQYTYSVTSKTQFVPRSADADIQGFGVGDYAYVIARSGVAHEVEYDTSPFKPGPLEHVDGQVTKVSTKGFFILQDSSGTDHKIWPTPQTSWYINGQPQSSPFTVQVGQTLDVFAQKEHEKWLAVSIDEQVSGSG